MYYDENEIKKINTKTKKLKNKDLIYFELSNYPHSGISKIKNIEQGCDN